MTFCPGLVPRQRPVSPVAAASALFEVDYLIVEHAEIYVGGSRHRVVVWLWFLS
jgi:hypothetical protein